LQFFPIYWFYHIYNIVTYEVYYWYKYKKDIYKKLIVEFAKNIDRIAISFIEYNMNGNIFFKVKKEKYLYIINFIYLHFKIKQSKIKH